ncbi:MAG: recombinase family protein, partial [Gammaproteobacteria bacterium]
GWVRSRVEIIDADLGISGRSIEGRLGFQRLLAEVSLDHVGIIFGLETSRLARSNKDWYHLLELCAIFRTLVADQDGLYDPVEFNDRLLLGLKGTLSEAELHILKGRMHEGKMNKAKRGELLYSPPPGYLKLPTGGVTLEPDEQARTVLRLVFEKFEELGSASAVLRYFCRHGVMIPIRPHDGSNRGQLEWRRATRAKILQILHHPMYAGAYSFGRRQVDPRQQVAGRSRTGRRAVPMEKWHVLMRQQLPAYITWDQYLENQRKLQQNRALVSTFGAPREGPSLLSGLLACGKCGSRMLVNYNSRVCAHRYVCLRQLVDFGDDLCQTLAGRVVDELVSKAVLQVLEPAAVELSLQVADDVERERERLEKHWKLRLERARYETDRARRQYDAVEPENRLVARELERRWDAALTQQRQLEDDFQRFQQEQSARLTEEQRARVQALASNIPALWQSPNVNTVDRQQIIRHLVERIVVNVQNKSEYVDVTIHWAGGFISQHETIRSVAKYEQLRDFKDLKRRILELDDAGDTAAEIAAKLNREGFRPAKLRATFNRITVRQLLYRFGRVARCTRLPLANRSQLLQHEWWLPSLAKKLNIPHSTIHNWARRGWITARQERGKLGLWIAWADADELDRLRRLHVCRRGQSIHQPYPTELTTPKSRP